MKRQHGFTLLELLLVISIIALLAGISVPQYREYVVRAQVAEGLVLAGPLKDAVTTHYDRWGVLPRDNAEAGLAPPEALRGSWVRSMEVRDGTISIRYFPDPLLPEQATLFLRPGRRPGETSGPIAWICHNALRGLEPIGVIDPAVAIPDKLVPGACR